MSLRARFKDQTIVLLVAGANFRVVAQEGGRFRPEALQEVVRDEIAYLPSSGGAGESVVEADDCLDSQQMSVARGNADAFAKWSSLVFAANAQRVHPTRDQLRQPAPRRATAHHVGQPPRNRADSPAREGEVEPAISRDQRAGG
jgi:hypothetical protein